MTKATKGVVRDGVVGQRTGLGPPSNLIAGQLPTRPEPPAPVTLTGTELTERIHLSWNRPTKNAAGDQLKQGAILGYNVYTATGSGIDVNADDPHKFVDATSYNYDPARPATYPGPYYFKVTAIDVDGGASTGSNEINKTAEYQTEGSTDISDLGAGGNVAQIIRGRGANLLIFPQPSSSWNGWLGYAPYYTTGSTGGAWTPMVTGGAAYPFMSFLHANLATGDAYKYKVRVVGKDGTMTTGTIHDNAGVGYVPNTTGHGALLSDVIGAAYAYVRNALYAETIYAPILQSPNYGTGAGGQIDLLNSHIRLGGSDAPGFYADGTGNAQIGGVNGIDYDATTREVTVQATFKTSSSGKRIEIAATGSLADEAVAISAANKECAGMSDAGFETWNSNGAGDANRTSLIPAATGTDAYFKHNLVMFHNRVAMGTDTDPATSHACYVTGTSRFHGNMNVTGAKLTVAGYASGSVAHVVNACRGTGAAPAGKPEGTLYVQYIP